MPSMETLLDAMTIAASLAFDENVNYPRADRQYLAFRERILRMDAERDTENQRLRGLLAEIEWSSYAIYATTVQYGVCPSCKAPREDGHFEGCRLAKELSDEV